MSKIISEIFLEHKNAFDALVDTATNDITNASDVIITAIKSSKCVFIAGNGGSAADAQHIAAEFTGRFVKERLPLPAVALTTDTSAITAIGNDYGFNQIFSRQLEALGKEGDVFIAISTSGNSENLITAINIAKEKGLITIGLLGKDGGKIKGMVNFPIVVPSVITARIQEMHILIGHIFCSYIDSIFDVR